MLDTPYVWDSYKAMLRADFTLFDTYTLTHALGDLKCSIHGCVAKLDKRITEEHLRGWDKLLAPGHAFHMMPAAEGTHLFMLDDSLKQQWFTQSLLPALQTQLDKVSPVAPPVSLAVETAAEEVVPPPAPRVKKTKLRILCLHGFGCCDEILTIQTKRLRDQTQSLLLSEGEEVEYDFVSAPDKAKWDPESYEVLTCLSR